MVRKSTAKVRVTVLALAAILAMSVAYLAFAAPIQTSTSWSDSFTDQAGIATLTNLNFSAGNLSLSNTIVL